MPDTKKTSSLRLLYLVVSFFLILSIGVFIALGISIQYQDLRETYQLAEETSSFLKSQCQKYDDYTQGNSARALQDLLDTATGLKKFVSSAQLSDPEFLHDFIRTEHVGGVIILDSSLSPIAQIDMDHQDSYALWHDTLSHHVITDILQHPQKTYIDHVTLNGTPYDLAAVASDDSDRLFFCYSSTEKPSTDPYELNIQQILINSHLHKNPALVITDGVQVLSTNDQLAESDGTTTYNELLSTIDWKDNQLTRFEYDGSTWYGLRRVYSHYFLYTLYPADEIFSNRTNFILFGLMAYLAVCVVLLAIQRHFDKISLRRMEKQLNIINAISTGYSSTYLLHLNKMELETIKSSPNMASLLEAHPAPSDFLNALCQNEVDANDRQALMRFFELDTLAKRLAGKPFLGCEVQDRDGRWFSFLILPQAYGADGTIEAVLITTRDITSMKQVEELSFKDQLTGLHNRNYMESRSNQFVRSGDFPVSLIMADCNYLKRTNDTLGHKYGDRLLQRVAGVIHETIPDHYIAMRVGGDEFLIVCTQCSRAEAEALVARLRRKLAERSDETLTLSVSFGISTTEQDHFSFEQAYKEADQEMYQDKMASRIVR